MNRNQILEDFDHEPATSFPDTYVVVTAAGSGTRLGANIPKALVKLDGRSILWWALRGLQQVPGLRGVVVTAAANAITQFETQIRQVSLPCPVQVVAGGATRQQSVAHGLQGLRRLYEDFWLAALNTPPADEPKVFPPDSEHSVCLVHDAARCLTPLSVFQRVITAVRLGAPAVVPALPVVDTIRLVASLPPAPTGTSSETNQPIPKLLTDSTRAPVKPTIPLKSHLDIPPVSLTNETKAASCQSTKASTDQATKTTTAQPTEAAKDQPDTKGTSRCETESTPNCETGSDSPLESRSEAQEIGLMPAAHTLERDQLRIVQTPQGFPGHLLYQAHGLGVKADNIPGSKHFPFRIPPEDNQAKSGHSFPAETDTVAQAACNQAGALDDSMLVAALGYPQYFVTGSDQALKITYFNDLKLAHWLLEDTSATKWLPPEDKAENE